MKLINLINEPVQLADGTIIQPELDIPVPIFRTTKILSRGSPVSYHGAEVLLTEVHLLPPEQPNTSYIVYDSIRTAAPDRTDLLSVWTVDENGNVRKFLGN